MANASSRSGSSRAFDVSVIIPLYGNHPGRRSLSSVVAAWLDQDLACEVVVATAGRITDVLPEPLRGDGRVRVVQAEATARAPGLLRNCGFEATSAPVLYLSDADVAPLGRDYLRRALRTAAGGVLSQPWMYRLMGDGVTGDVARLRVDGQGRACDEFCFVTSDTGVLRPLGSERVQRIRREHVGDIVGMPVVRLPFGMPRGRGDRRNWRAPFHWGGLLLSRQAFVQVGGYCRRYLGWGCEDDDLLVKLGSLGTVTRGWQTDPTITCLHFEHAYPSAGRQERAANRAIYRERHAAGPAAMIGEDLVDSPAPSTTRRAGR